MSIHDQDTDPASPEARRPAAEPDATSSSAGSRGPRAATTEPGVGPPSRGARPTGVVVPPSGRGLDPRATGAAQAKDSVELLLEGIGGPRPDRTKTMPRTSGEASAAYHAEHAVHAARTAQEEEQKVLVDTVRLPAAVEQPPVARPAAGEATFVTPARMGPRIAVAILAGLLVVGAVSALLGRQPRRAAAPSPAAASPATVAPVAVVAPAVDPPASFAPTPRAEPPAEPIPAPPGSVAARPKSAAPRARAAPADLGEFKTSF